jgi:hypothetical protein
MRLSCVPPVAIMILGAPTGGCARPSRSALFRKPTFSITTHCSDAGSPRSILVRSTTQACFCVMTVGEIGSSLLLVGM